MGVPRNMADEHSTWIDWPHSYAQPHMGQTAPRVEENSNSNWGSPFYNFSKSNLQFSANNDNNTQSHYYPSDQQQAEPYVLLEDVLPYPREYQRQAPYAENSELPTSLSQHSLGRATGRQLLNTMPQLHSGSEDANAANDAYSGHDVKRQRVEAPLITQAPSQASLKVASPVYSQVRTQPVLQDTRSGTNHNTSQTHIPPTSEPATQPAIQRMSQLVQRPGSQYVVPGQARPTTQAQSQHTAFLATTQQRVSQYALQVHPEAAPRALSSASPLTTAQQPSWRNSPCASPQIVPQSLPVTVAPSTTQYTAQQHRLPVSRSGSQYSSPYQTPALPQTVASSDAQIRPPYTPWPNLQPRTQLTNLPQISRAAPQRNPKQPSKPIAKSTAQPVSRSTAQSAPQPPSQIPSQPVSPPAVKTAIPTTQQHIPLNLSNQRALSTQPAPPVSQPLPQMAQTPHSQPLSTCGKFATYKFRPEDPADRTFLKSRTDIVSPLNEADAAQKTAYDPKTIARDILIAAGRHPTEAHLNHHLDCLRDIFTHVDMNSDLATFRWDLVDPREPSREMKIKTSTQSVPLQTSQTTAPHPVVQAALPINNTFIPQQYSDQTQHNPPQPALQQVQPPSPPSQQADTQYRTQLPSEVQPQAQLQGQQPLHSQDLQPGSQTPNTANSMEKRRRGRPPGSTNKPKVVVASVARPQRTSSYPVFACRWGNCQSELHNLELLKKHILKIHVSYQITCGWKGCTFTGTLPAAELMNHVRKEHLDSLAWKLGDGPAVLTSVDQDISAVPLTIPDSYQPGNEDTLIFPAEYNSIRAFNKVHGNNSQLEKAHEVFKAVQRLKIHIGVGLDPGGCELATPLRNQRVSNDEEVYEVRPAS
ncbi:hypothetical protein BDW72DRAFT_25284 [Aspergillus terricola var. indicus]